MRENELDSSAVKGFWRTSIQIDGRAINIEDFVKATVAQVFKQVRP